MSLEWFGWQGSSARGHSCCLANRLAPWLSPTQGTGLTVWRRWSAPREPELCGWTQADPGEWKHLVLTAAVTKLSTSATHTGDQGSLWLVLSLGTPAPAPPSAPLSLKQIRVINCLTSNCPSPKIVPTLPKYHHHVLPARIKVSHLQPPSFHYQHFPC